MLEILEIQNQTELEKLRPEWDSLLERSRNSAIFQTPQWLLPYYGYYGTRQMRTLAVRNQGVLVGLAPLEIAHMYGLPLKRLQFIGNGATDYLDFILDSSHEPEVLEILISYLEKKSNCWDIMDLQQIPEGSPTIAYWKNRITKGPLKTSISPEEPCPILPLPDSWDTFLQSLGKKTRWNIRYYERVARRDHDLQIAPLADYEIKEGMDALFRLHANRWRKRGLPGVLAGTRRKKFHRDVAKNFAARGWLRLYALKLDGMIQAVLYCFFYRGKAYYYLGGFEPSLSKLSLGTILTSHVIKDSVENGIHHFDFLRGDEPYKSRWTQVKKMNHRILMMKPSMKSRTALEVIHMEQSIEHRFKTFMYSHFGGH